MDRGDSELNLSHKVALVTGAGQSIGRGIALELAKHGASIAVNDINELTAEKTANEIKETGIEAISVVADVSKIEEVNNMVDSAMKHFNKIDILINNAGIAHNKPMLDYTEDLWDLHLNIIAKGTFLCMNKVAPIMLANKWGRIINIGSYLAQFNVYSKWYGPYCAAKAAVIALTQVAAQEWAPDILVNAVGPGDVETEMMEKEWQEAADRLDVPKEKVKEEYRSRLILRRFEKPSDISKVVLFLCSPLANQITGSHLIAGGGLPFVI